MRLRPLARLRLFSFGGYGLALVTATQQNDSPGRLVALADAVRVRQQPMHGGPTGQSVAKHIGSPTLAALLRPSLRLARRFARPPLRFRVASRARYSVHAVGAVATTRLGRQATPD